MILLVDVGNSRIKWIVWELGRVVARGDLIHDGVDRTTLGFQMWSQLSPPERLIVANVAGAELADAITAWSERAWSVTPWFATTQAASLGITIAYQVPQRLGVDRWVAMLGARTITRDACCIVDCGTATTVDALTETGRHLGGVILPGARLMRESLYRNTRQIPGEPGETTLFGKDTHFGVWGGTTYAVAAAIDHITSEMEQAMQGTVRRILTGGDVGNLCRYLRMNYRIEPDLIFKGLLVAAGES